MLSCRCMACVDIATGKVYTLGIILKIYDCLYCVQYMQIWIWSEAHISTQLLIVG